MTLSQKAGDSLYKPLNALLRYLRSDQMLNASAAATHEAHFIFLVDGSRLISVDGSRLISVVLMAYFEARNRNSST
jgi:hypothetical protein